MAGFKRRIDPAYIAVAAAIDDVEFAMRAVAEQQDRRVGQIHPHDRLADRQSRQFGAHLGDNDRSRPVPIRRRFGFGFLIDRRQNEGPCRL